MNIAPKYCDLLFCQQNQKFSFSRSSSLVALHAWDGVLLVSSGDPVHRCEAQRLLGDVRPPPRHPGPANPQVVGCIDFLLSKSYSAPPSCWSWSQAGATRCTEWVPSSSWCTTSPTTGWSWPRCASTLDTRWPSFNMPFMPKIGFDFIFDQRCCDIAFVMFCLTWTYSRIGIFPTWIIYSTTSEAAQVFRIAWRSWLLTPFCIPSLFRCSQCIIFSTFWWPCYWFCTSSGTTSSPLSPIG